MEKPNRHRAIARVVASGVIRTQEQLRALLKEAGVRATQGTLSRDLRELGVAKGPGGYSIPSAPSARSQAQLGEVLAARMVSAEVAGTLVILRTDPGNAQSIAVLLDSAPPLGVAGTLAGDDTVFIATRSTRDAVAVHRTLRHLAGA